jgi:nucleoside-diphosphate-sugar epimerase
MNVLITGANGFLGKYIFDYFSSTDNKVYSLSRNANDYKIDLKNEIPNFNENFELIIHAASLAHLFDNPNNNKNLYYEVNVVGTENLLKGLEKISYPQRFVYISSVAVYGIENGVKINEETMLNATDAYGKSKVQVEEIIQTWCSENNIILTILRLPLVVGFNPPGNLGKMIRSIKSGYYFNIDGGKAKKSMVLAEDVAANIQKASLIGGIFNLTDDYDPTFYEISHLIAKQNKIKYIPNLSLFFAKFLANIGDIFGPNFPFNNKKLNKIISTLTFDTFKAKQAFGWNPTPVLKKLKI